MKNGVRSTVLVITAATAAALFAAMTLVELHGRARAAPARAAATHPMTHDRISRRLAAAARPGLDLPMSRRLARQPDPGALAPAEQVRSAGDVETDLPSTPQRPASEATLVELARLSLQAESGEDRRRLESELQQRAQHFYGNSLAHVAFLQDLALDPAAANRSHADEVEGDELDRRDLEPPDVGEDWSAE